MATTEPVLAPELERANKELKAGKEARRALDGIAATLLVNFGPDGRSRDLARIERSPNVEQMMLSVIRQLAGLEAVPG